MESVIDARGGVIYATGSLGGASGTQKIRPPQYLHIHNIRTHTSTESPDVNVLYVVCAHI